MDRSPSKDAVGVQFNPIFASSLQSLVDAAIDYAGLFPPCELPLDQALKKHAADSRSDEAWLLNGFVLPVAKFSEARSLFAQFDSQNPLRISALGGKSESMSDFIGKLPATLETIRQLKAGNDPAISVVQLEIALPPNCDLDGLQLLNTAAAELRLRVFCEAPPVEAERVIGLLAENNRTRKSFLGYKLRTGGVTADAFPDSAEVARALIAAGQKGVPIKFTAGLHHPVRHFRDEVKTKMHGFLNVLGAGVLAAEHSWDQATTVKMLEDEDPEAFAFDKDTFAWREWKITADAIRSRRKLVTSFGSCSFDEPRDDLRELGLL